MWLINIVSVIFCQSSRLQLTYTAETIEATLFPFSRLSITPAAAFIDSACEEQTRAGRRRLCPNRLHQEPQAHYDGPAETADPEREVTRGAGSCLVAAR